MSVGTNPLALKMTRALAVTITFGVGVASFALSFTALRDLATRGHVPAGQAWLWPLMVDGAILLATLGVVVMAGDPQCRSDRRFFWQVLVGGGLLSVACNALHAILPGDQPLPAWMRGLLAGVAPIALLVTTHGLTLLTRMHRRAAALAATASVVDDARADVPDLAGTGPTTERPDRPQERAGDDISSPSAVSARSGLTCPPDSPWHARAPRVHQDAALKKDTGHDEVAEILFLSFDQALADREIGRRLDLSHHTVAKVVRVGSSQLAAGNHQPARAAS